MKKPETAAVPDENAFAIVLPGAVARGAYEAGVLDVLAESGCRVHRIVATSSGALNGLAYAAGLRAGREREAARKLLDAWLKRGSWQSSFNLNVWGLLRGRGLSSRDGLMELMRSIVEPCRAEVKVPVEFRVIVTPLNGVVSCIGARPATTFETVLKFQNEDFDTQEGLERMFKAVSAACAFPGLFDPVDLPGLGLCVDGGAVNNAPIRYALEESGVTRVLMPVPFPALMPAGKWGSGFSLLNHLIEILINERLYRDLKEAQAVNRDAQAIRRLAARISAEQVAEIHAALSIREVEIIQVRPESAFKTSPFAGFFHRVDRQRLIDAGREAARSALGLSATASGK